MKTRADRIRNLADTFSALLEREQQACEELVATADAAQSAAVLKKIQARFDLLVGMGRDDFLAKIKRETEEVQQALADSRAAAVLLALVRTQPSSLQQVCESLLDGLIDTTGAERGFILFYTPESTEAEVIAARNFQTRNLALAEYQFSRSLLREVFKRHEPLLLEDASGDPAFSKEASVINLELKSVLAAPLKQNGRAVGALYLENNRLASAFDEEDARLLASVAEFAVFYLQNARLLPVAFERDTRVFFDESRAATEIIGRDPKMLALLDTVNRIADSPATVLIEGESGTGKELVARALHYQSARRARPFVAINCAAIPDNLLESELFGHEKGAFTGATARHIGRIEQGDGGTIFLDEISELAYPLQAKLLRFLQANEFHRLGGRETIRVDARVVAATSKDLEALTAAGKFQEALYYRLYVIPVRLPALRERKADIPLLMDYFVSKFSAIYGKAMRAEREVYEWLQEYPFPGNVREMENLIHRLVALAPDETIRVGDLPGKILQTRAQRIGLGKDPLYEALCAPPHDLEELRRQREEARRIFAERERQLAERAVREADGNLTEAAARMGIHRTMLHRLLKGDKSK
ncbi:MAG TPA: sigma-54-dependent Fis family transcriptional regulator [Blastocatellia bacterium]|nr:sigma-54-dependent Fis family transcriptional regulator [Blastocatellia bacterium]